MESQTITALWVKGQSEREDGANVILKLFTSIDGQFFAWRGDQEKLEATQLGDFHKQWYGIIISIIGNYWWTVYNVYEWIDNCK